MQRRMDNGKLLSPRQYEVAHASSARDHLGAKITLT
jgi:hypothetical protein